MEPSNNPTQKNVLAFSSTIQERRQKPLSSAVQTALAMYFRDLDGHHPGGLYDMVMAEMERPLLEMTLRHAGGNLSRAAEILGICRSTLRKKLNQYSLI